MSPKRKRKKPLFHGIDIKLRRANIHLSGLDHEFEGLVDRNFYSFMPEIKDDGRTHIYRAVDPPPDGIFWGAIIGEAAHALRSSLDHLAWQLVLAAGKNPGRVQFPVLRERLTTRRFKMLPRPRKRVRLRIEGRVPPRAFSIIEAVQPYHGTYEGRNIDALNTLDIFDKHRELIVAATVVKQATTSYDDDGRIMTIDFPGNPVKDGEIVAIVTHDPPQLEPDPHLKFRPSITFAKGSPFAGEIATEFLWNLWWFVANDLMVRFDEWLPMKGA